MKQILQLATTHGTKPTHGKPTHQQHSANMTRGDKLPQSQPLEQKATSRAATQDNTSGKCRRRRKTPPPTHR
jgi:hypothetical protein